MGSGPLPEAELRNALDSLEGWRVQAGKLHKEFQFADFNQAFGFMTRVALVAEQQSHHPEWFNVWNRVVVDLTTHDADGITASDIELAKEMNRLA
ncbi:MAG: 4a-hydroxytetrahydrobiopterin dehydratase [bacterium]|nr:4a-hydroxytetrahydrobiopterin dehydratase [bacterium]